VARSNRLGRGRLSHALSFRTGRIRRIRTPPSIDVSRGGGRHAAG
jgi:hypothetical protein